MKNLGVYKNKKTGVEAVLLSEHGHFVFTRGMHTKEVCEIPAREWRREWRYYRMLSNAEQEPQEQPQYGTQTVSRTKRSKGAKAPKHPATREEQQALEKLALEKMEKLYDTLNESCYGGRVPALSKIEILFSPKAFAALQFDEKTNLARIGAGLLNRSTQDAAVIAFKLLVYRNCNHNHVSVVCNGGRYHNRVFQQIATAQGFTVTKAPIIGYGEIQPDVSFAAKLHLTTEELNVPFLPRKFQPVSTIGDAAQKRNAVVRKVCLRCGTAVLCPRLVDVRCDKDREYLMEVME